MSGLVVFADADVDYRKVRGGLMIHGRPITAQRRSRRPSNAIRSLERAQDTANTGWSKIKLKMRDHSRCVYSARTAVASMAKRSLVGLA